MKVISAISKILKYIVIIIVIAIIATLVIPKFIGYTPYTVITGSMEPKYHVGCVTYVKQIDYDELKDGDVKATDFSIPYLGYAIVWIGTVKGKVLLLIILAGLSAASAILKSLANDQAS